LGSEKRKFWKIPLILAFFSAPVVAWLGFGEQGLVHLYRTEVERKAYVERIRRLAEENQALLEEVHRLRTDMEYMESVARKELHLIRENETIYRFDQTENPEKHTGRSHKNTRYPGGNGLSEKEVR
jgi:cell division protein FtsB